MSASAAFQGPSPYDDAVATLCNKNEEDWGAILDLCDKISSEKEKGYAPCACACAQTPWRRRSCAYMRCYCMNT